ncbi:MAG: outer membrane beta-barrel protein [Prosthecochloris sp.]|uniref:Outer surface protein, putative n=1 Tax=Prosthecochloris aestuarii (strain DSM 271 / SK 413) TaxID=290512 RepID=B4S813_PROA2|nr:MULTISPECIES: outer membrane beta-barrel protein [Prosthecochloris]ACF46200.1 outer surface protein, putative [Prosthecochloris aestuarii DSM 271]MCW8798875.1 outer membrane beta-barrel protein [Prosthecochloris sp.]NEX11909.1 porin family protein [Prosthecochloris sp.]
MSRKLLSGLTCSCCAIVFFQSAYAGSPYAGLTVGKAYLNNSSIKGSNREYSCDDGEGYCYAHGLELGNFRLEGEIGYQKNDFDAIEPGVRTANGDLSILSLLGNGYYSLSAQGSRVMPVISAGVGVANIEFEDEVNAVDDSDLVLAYQVGAGLGYKLSESVTVTTMYRYFSTSDAGFDEEADDLHVDISSHNIMMGVKVNF